MIYTNDLGASITLAYQSCTETPYTLTSIDSLSSNTSSVSESKTYGGYGSVVSSVVVEPKDETYEGDFPTNQATRQKLIDTVLPGVKAHLRYIDTERNIDVFRYGYPLVTPIISDDPGYQRFQFTMHSPYPFWTMTAISKAEFYKFNSLFSFPYTFSSTVPWKISQLYLVQNENVYNPSPTRLGYKIRIKARGGITGPKFWNVDTQEGIRFKDSFSMQLDDELEISTLDNEKGVFLIRNGVRTSVFKYLNHDSTVFTQLEPGDNIMHYEATSGTAQMSVTFELQGIQMGM